MYSCSVVAGVSQVTGATEFDAEESVAGGRCDILRVSPTDDAKKRRFNVIIKMPSDRMIALVEIRLHVMNNRDVPESGGMAKMSARMSITMKAKKNRHIKVIALACRLK